MKKIVFFILFASFFQAATGQNADIEKLTKLNSDWLELSVKKDTATIAKIFANDFILTTPRGSKMTKTDVVKNILNQDLQSVKIDSIEIRLITNDVGIVTCYTTFALTLEGKKSIGQNCYQDVYVKRKGQWVAISAHVTLLNLK